MRVFVVSNNAKPDRAPYLEAILALYGLCDIERASLDEALQKAEPNCDVLLISSDLDSAQLEPFLRAGGHVIAAPLGESLARTAGATLAGTRMEPGRLRFTEPICPGARGEPIWTIGPQSLFRATGDHADLSVSAYLFEPGNFGSESLGIWHCPVGDGLVTAFGYDVAGCVERLRQGLPERANSKPPGDPIPRPTHLHAPNPPQDTLWRPTADLHCFALCEVVRDALARQAPVPLLWQIPAGKASLLIFSGDEDGSVQEANQCEMRAVEACDGTMSLYFIPEITSITREHIDAYTRAGHEISAHPNLTFIADKSVDEQLAKAEADVMMVRERFGLPVRTVRNHSTMWPGYLELPELWERLGIGMDSNMIGSLYYDSQDGGPYAKAGAAMPLPFVRGDGSLIDVYEQPFHCSDDVMCNTTIDHPYSLKYGVEEFVAIFERIFDDAARFFYSPVCVDIHPGNYVEFSGEQGRSLLGMARKMDMPIWSMERWHDFWRARESWRMSERAWADNRLSFTLAGQLCAQLWFTLPAVWQGLSLRSLAIDGAPFPHEQVERHGKALAQAPLPVGATKVRVVADYD